MCYYYTIVPLQYGLEVHHSVCILGDPSPNCHIANMAAIMAGYVHTPLVLDIVKYFYSAKSVAIDQHSSPDTCVKIANHCSADIIVVDKPHQLDKILKVHCSCINKCCIILVLR